MQAQRASQQPREVSTGGILTLLADVPAPETARDPAMISRETSDIVRARQNPAAFAPLYERYVDVIYGYCRRRIGDPEQAADMTAQVFTRALGAMPRYTGNGSTFRSWLFSIAHNLLVDTYRKQRDIASLDKREHLQLVDDARPGPERLALQADLRDALQCAMRELTDRQREVVELRLAGLTGPEIATVLNMKIAAVKSTQFRAYARLREILAPYSDPSPSRKEGQP